MTDNTTEWAAPTPVAHACPACGHWERQPFTCRHADADHKAEPVDVPQPPAHAATAGPVKTGQTNVLVGE